MAAPPRDESCIPACRGSRGEVAAAVPSDGTHSAVPVLLAGDFSTSAAASFELVLQFPPPFFAVKIAGIGKDNALLPAKGERTLSYHQHVVRSFHDRPRGQ